MKLDSSLVLPKMGMMAHTYNLALGRERQENQEFQVLFGYIGSSKPALDM